MKSSFRLVAVLLGAAMMVPAAASAEPPPTPDLLPAPIGGEEAIAALGDSLADVAQRNGVTAEELTDLLATDSSALVDGAGRIRFVEPLPPPEEEAAGISEEAAAAREEAAAAGEEAPAISGEAAGASDGSGTANGPYPNSKTFQLHSKPGSQRVIYLDFNGAKVSGTAWNQYDRLPAASYPGFDLDGRPASWSQQEHNAIQSIFQRVAEDYAPFDVDVTTQDPGAAAIERSSSGDTRYGTVALISNSEKASRVICDNECGGVAYLRAFGAVGNRYYQPAWVFSHMLRNNTKAIAESASHEVGHNLGLRHDGTAREGYYAGHGGWAPIMGVGYQKPVVQFSKGEYRGANNREDDFAVIRSNGLTPRSDEAGSGISSAARLGTAATRSGVIASAADVDVFSISRTCSKSTTIRASGASPSPNLDIGLRLLDKSGKVLASSNPPLVGLGPDASIGLGASVTKSLAPGTYYVEVAGVGFGSSSNGYSDYGSIGQYSLSITGC